LININTEDTFSDLPIQVVAGVEEDNASHSAQSKSASCVLPVGGKRPQQDFINVNMQILRDARLRLACVVDHVCDQHL
jgi:hypothetical protein